MRRAALLLTTLATVQAAGGVASADSPYPVGPPNQPTTYGDCVSTTAAGEGVEDYTVPVKDFVALVGAPNSRRPGTVDAFTCKGFSPPGV